MNRQFSGERNANPPRVISGSHFAFVPLFLNLLTINSFWQDLIYTIVFRYIDSISILNFKDSLSIKASSISH